MALGILYRPEIKVNTLLPLKNPVQTKANGQGKKWKKGMKKRRREDEGKSMRRMRKRRKREQLFFGLIHSIQDTFEDQRRKGK